MNDRGEALFDLDGLILLDKMEGTKDGEYLDRNNEGKKEGSDL